MSKESELAKRITDAVKAIDKLVGHITADSKDVLQKLDELKKLKGKNEGKEEA